MNGCSSVRGAVGFAFSFGRAGWVLLASDAVSCSFDSALVPAFGGTAGAAAIGPFLIVRVACLIVACVTPRSIWETLANRFVLTDLSQHTRLPEWIVSRARSWCSPVFCDP